MKNEHCRASLCSYRTRSEANKRISVSILGAAVSLPFALKRKGSGTYNKRFRINAVMRSDEIAHGIRYSDADGIFTVMQIRCKLERIVKHQRSGVPAVYSGTMTMPDLGEDNATTKIGPATYTLSYQGVTTSYTSSGELYAVGKNTTLAVKANDYINNDRRRFLHDAV